MSTEDASPNAYYFGEFTLDVDRGILLNGSDQVPLRAKSYDVLRYLIEHNGQLVSKDALLAALWPETVVTDDAVTQCIVDIRRAITDTDQQKIRTVPRRGYVLEVPVRRGKDTPDNGQLALRNWFGWRTAMGIAVMVIAASAYYAIDRSTERSQALPVPSAGNSIAVLPFVNMSDDAENEYFAHGISEELLTLLTQVPDLRVISRTSSFVLADRNLEISALAADLNVAHVLEGSVRKDGNRVRITAQLIDGRTDLHVWSKAFDRELDDVFAIQSEIAADVATALRLTFSDVQSHSSPVDPRAHDLMMRARFLLNQYDQKYHAEIENLLQQASEISPDYVLALTELARLYMHQGNVGLRHRDETEQLYRKTVGRAYELEPDNGVVNLFVGLAPLFFQADIYGPASYLEAAMYLAPENHFVSEWVQNYSLEIGRFETTIALGKHNVARDPFCLRCRFDLAQAYGATGDYEKATAMYEVARTLDIDSVYPMQYFLGVSLLLSGNAEAGLEAIDAEDRAAPKLVGRAFAYHDLGRKSDFQKALQKVLELNQSHAAAAVYAWSGDIESAFQWLFEGFERDPLRFGQIYRNPVFRNLHGDPRWAQFLVLNKASPEQLAAIEFDIPLPTQTELNARH